MKKFVRFRSKKCIISGGLLRQRVELRHQFIESEKATYLVAVTRPEAWMREAGLEARQRRRWRYTTDSEHNLPVAPNLLSRQFMVAESNRV